LPSELIDCCEAFVDNCMNLTATAEKTMIHRNTISARLKKLKSLTGLDPTSNFRDAFLV
jgi:carbohydrate diacid regulator